MRVYNGTKSQLDLPLSGNQRITIPPRTVSGDVMPNHEFLSLLVSSFDYSEIALIVSGPYEITMCASVSGSVGFVVQTLEEAIERFAEKKPEEIKSKEDEPTIVDNENKPTDKDVETNPKAEVIKEEGPKGEEEVNLEVEKKETKKTRKGNK